MQKHLNDQAPWRIANCITKKEQWLVNHLWPRMKQMLQKEFNTEFTLDSDFNIYYDNSKTTKPEVLTTIGKVYMQYYNKKLNLSPGDAAV